MYDFKHRVIIGNDRTIEGRSQFDKVDMNLFPTILDSTAICSNATRCSCCHGYDHVKYKRMSLLDTRGGNFVLSKFRGKAGQNQASRKKPVLTLIESNVISAPILCKSTSVDPAEALSRSAYVPSEGHVKISLHMTFLFWEQNLRSHPDLLFVQTILDGIRFGVKIGFNGPQMSLESNNWPSSLEHFDEVSEIIRMYSVVTSQGLSPTPLADFRCSPLVAVPIKSDGIRIINNLSWSVKISIDEFVSSDDFLLSYTSVDMAVQCIQLFDDPYISK